MKKLTLTVIVSTLLFSSSAQAQLWDKIKQKAEQKAEELLTKKKTKKASKKSSRGNNDYGGNTEDTFGGLNSKIDVWRNYKFVPGEDVIFYDDLRYEEVGEFPSRWDIRKGGAEIARFDDDKVIIGTATYDNVILPLFKKGQTLGDEFTIEFDVYVDELSKTYNNSWTDYHIILNSNNIRDKNIDFSLRSGTTDGYVGKYDFQIESVSLGVLNAWHHISISYYKGKFKMFYDEKRIVNLPRVIFTPNTFAINMSGKKDGSFNRDILYGIRNIRIAKGGGSIFQKMQANGKYVTNGILFDSGKSTVKKQSLGIINKMVDVLKDNKDWKCQIIGHTDADGNPEANLKLSEQRAKAIKEAIVSQGIKADRLTIVGKGESELISTATTTEEKLKNRRVEFIKI